MSHEVVRERCNFKGRAFIKFPNGDVYGLPVEPGYVIELHDGCVISHIAVNDEPAG